MFLRGHGSQAHAQNNGSTIGVTSTLHQSGALGQVQGDGMRNFPGWFVDRYPWEAGALSSLSHGPFHDDGPTPGSWRANIAIQGSQRVGFDPARAVPTATENRPVNTAVRYLIRAAR